MVRSRSTRPILAVRSSAPKISVSAKVRLPLIAVAADMATKCAPASSPFNRKISSSASSTLKTISPPSKLFFNAKLFCSFLRILILSSPNLIELLPAILTASLSLAAISSRRITSPLSISKIMPLSSNSFLIVTPLS